MAIHTINDRGHTAINARQVTEPIDKRGEEPPESRTLGQLSQDEMRQLSGPRIGEPAEGVHQALSDVAVAGEALHQPFEVGQWLALHARSPERVVEPLASWLAGGAIEAK